MVTGPNVVEYISNLDKQSEDVSSRVLDQNRLREQEKYDNILAMDGKDNAYVIHKELGEWMTDNVTVVRENKKLLATDEKIQELMERYQNININDTSKWSNSGAAFTRQLWNMLQLARVITIGAYNRNESRGAHYKPEFPERNDDEWLKTTKASFNAEKNGPEFSYEDIDLSLIKPRKRDYTTKH
jgi:succinate dehydrogenase / fumarate reductase flavoprotein subunit